LRHREDTCDFRNEAAGSAESFSQFPVVIFPLFMQHFVLLSRNLVYTGLTRAKQLAILVGLTKAIGLAVKRVMDRQRYTALAERLKRLEPST
jgi:exodeoxyribonuclease V alpha subunit